MEDIAELIEDCPHSTAKDEGQGFALIRTPNIGIGHLIFDNVHRVSKEVYDIRNARAVPQINDIIYAREAPAGNAAIINDKEKVCLGQRTVLIRPMQKLIDSMWLTYTINSPYARKTLISKATGSTVTHVNMENIRSLALPLPPLQEQSRIVESIEHWLSLVDCIEESNNNLQEAIRQTKSKILDLAIHGKLVPQDPTDELASELLKRINPKAEITSDNGHYQKLPEGWVITSISEMCENINGLWKGKKEPFVKVGVIRNANFTKDFKLDYSKIEYIDVEERAFKKRHLLNGDLIVEKSGGSDNNPVGRAILYEGKDAIFSFSNFTMVLRIHYKDVLSYKYLYYYIMSKYQKGEMRLMQTQTTGLHNLILDKYLDIPLCLPPYQEQQRIINKIEETFGVLDLIMENL